MRAGEGRVIYYLLFDAIFTAIAWLVEIELSFGRERNWQCLSVFGEIFNVVGFSESYEVF